MQAQHKWAAMYTQTHTNTYIENLNLQQQPLGIDKCQNGGYEILEKVRTRNFSFKNVC